jgi:N6-L-threonylcarbamoyladenine synthase
MPSGAEGAGDAALPADEVFPAVSLVISGGHSALYLSESWTAHRLLGATTDDAVGEAFDKAASILGLGYPGGPAISRAAQEGRAGSLRFPRSLIDSDSLDFSFSGIKTAVLYHVKGQNARRDSPIRAEVSVPDVAAAFEEAVVEVLIAKLRRALEQEGVRTAIVGGGVAANRRLRERLDRLARKEDLRLLYPPAALCTDNGAMIAGLGYRLLLEGRRDDLSLDADPVTAR